MRIALVTHHAHSHGGVPQYVIALATVLAQDHEVTIFSNDFEGLEDTAVRHRRVWAMGSSGFLWPVTFSLWSSLLLILSHLKKTGRFDIIHTHGDYAAFADVNTSHFCEAEEVERLRRHRPGVTLGERLHHRVTALLEKGLVTQSKGKPLIVLSERMKREFLSHYGSLGERLFVISSGVDSTKYSPANRPLYRNEIRHHRVPAADTLVLFIGGDWERKGLPQAIKALARLRSSEVTLLVVGRGDTAHYRKLARKEGVEKRVIFAGPVEETWKYYAASDIFLLPSLYEPFGLCILEAMSTGVPVVISREAGAAELIQDRVNGLLLKNPGDVAEIGAKLDLLVGDDEFRRRLGDRARQTAMECTWSGVAKSTIEVYQQALRNRRN